MLTLDDLRGPECRRCGASLEGKRADAVYCGKACYMADYAELEKAARREAKQGKACAHCSGPISVEKNSKAMYCSVLCQNRAFHDRYRLKFPSKCKICGDEFHGHNARQIYCSPSCRAKAGVEVRRLRRLFST